MDAIFPGLHATAPQRLPFGRSLEVRAFLLERERGNLLIYQADTLPSEERELRELGGVARQYLGHEHEAAPTSAWVRATFGAPLFAHLDAAEAARKEDAVDQTFALPEKLDEDFEIVPIPGHTPGSTAYLWNSDRHRVLFTADSVYWLEGRWIGVLLDETQRARFIESLEVLRSLEFDAIAPWVAQEGDPPIHYLERASATRIFDEIIKRIAGGGNR